MITTCFLDDVAHRLEVGYIRGSDRYTRSFGFDFPDPQKNAPQPRVGCTVDQKRIPALSVWKAGSAAKNQIHLCAVGESLRHGQTNIPQPTGYQIHPVLADR